MNQRPSTSGTPPTESRSGEAVPLASRLTARRASSIRRGLLVFLGVAPVLFIGGGTWLGLRFLQKSMAGDENARITNAASLSKQLVDRVLAERSRQVQLIASSPSVIAAAQRGGSVSRDRGLQDKSVAELEAMFKGTRSQQVDAAARSFLADLETKLDIAEVLVTDQYGYNAVTTAPSNDFVQSDEGWWKAAWNTGATSAQAKYDSATRSTVVELASMLRDRGSKVGVVKVKFGLSVVDSVLAQGSVGETTLRVDLVDSTGQVIATSAGGDRFRQFSGFSTVQAQESGGVFAFTADSVEQRGAVALTNGGRWRIVAHMSDADAGRAYFIAKWVLVAAVIAILVLVAVSLFFVSRFIEKRITGPAAQLARVAQAVADGDLSKEVTHAHTDDEIGRLAHAIAGMISELRRLASVLNETTEETGKMTAEITASSEEMAASAGQIAHTAADLSHQSTVMAETILGLAGASEQLVSTASDLDEGAREGTERNSRLRALAAENRARLDHSSAALAALSTDAQAGAAAIDQLVEASEEIRSFVTLVQKLARQSKLLALNAAMEAARAGDHGHGFAVVAVEMRRLSAMSSDAAERTERVVSGVLKGVAESRATSARTLDTVRSVHGATEQGSRSFGNIEQAVAEADQWASAIQSTVTSASGLARDLRAKLDSLATGTESFAAAMQEVAASSEEQSASTEQIAAAASVLSGAADRLSNVVANLKVESATAAYPIPVSHPHALQPGHAPVRRETPSHGSISLPPSVKAPSWRSSGSHPKI
jgi:methyl-accepting chemotaxis protein